MAATLQLRPKHRTLHNPNYLIHVFFSSSTDQSSVSSYFSDLKAFLKQQPQQQNPKPTSPFPPRNPTNRTNPSFSKPSKVASLEEIRKNLSDFRHRSSVPPPSPPSPTEPNLTPSSSQSQHISTAMKTEFVKMYSYGELGEKLRNLRPEAKKEGEGCFSLGELNERLMRLREMDEKETQSRIGGVSFGDLRESLFRLRMLEDEKAKKTLAYRLDILGDQRGRTPNFMLQLPKEQLVEKMMLPHEMRTPQSIPEILDLHKSTILVFVVVALDYNFKGAFVVHFAFRCKNMEAMKNTNGDIFRSWNEDKIQKLLFGMMTSFGTCYFML